MRRAGLAVGAALAMVGSALAALEAPPAGAGPRPTVVRLVASPVCGTPPAGQAACNAVQLTRRRVPLDSPLRGVRPAATALPSGLRGPTGNGYSPTALATAYRLPVTAKAPTGFVVAIVDGCNVPNVDNDLSAFDAQYGLAAENAATYRRIYAGGTGVCDDATGWEIETSLDVEAIRGLCRLCRILLVQAASASVDDLDRAVTAAAGYRGWVQAGHVLPVRIISNSYGVTENGDVPSSFTSTFNHPGVAILASTGDDGWYGWDYINVGGRPDGRPQIPAALNTVVAVGGTSLLLHSDGTRSSETVWDSDGPADSTRSVGASGGGCSFLHTAPGWQKSVPNYSTLGCRSGYRLATDIAADADPATGYDIVTQCWLLGCTWRTVGGTSLAAPLVAAMWALAGGPQGVKYPSLTLYGNAKAHSWSVYDVANGGNGFCGKAGATSCRTAVGGNPNYLGYGRIACEFSYGTIAAAPRQCHATSGYDGPTGIGAPANLQVFHPLVPTAVITLPAFLEHGIAATFGSGHSIDPFPGGHVAVSTWNWGDGTTSRTTSLSPRHTYPRAGRYVLSLVVTDNYGRSSARSYATVTVS